MSKKTIIITLFCAALCFSAIIGCSNSGSGGWVSLFDGKTLDGWQVSENPASARVEDGVLICNGERGHVFYTGPVNNANFKNFELIADVMTKPGANSGIYIHTRYQEQGWPETGYEIQVNNTHTGSDGYYEYKKTGSLYGIRNVYKQLVKDHEWFTMHIIVRGQRIMVYVNDMQVVDYVEPDSSALYDQLGGSRLTGGTLALQCHDPESTVFYKNIKIKLLPDDITEPVEQPAVDSAFVQIVQLGTNNFPLVDFHVHLKGELTLADALAKSRHDGIFYGLAANCGMDFPINTDAGLVQYLESMKNVPAFIGMQAEGREWVNMFSPAMIAKFDYVFTDAMTFTDDNGKRIHLWINDEIEITDKQAFMDMYVDKIIGVMDNEPIDIYVNPTFLPEVIQPEYDQLWTADRMLKVIDAAVKNDVAIEINNRYRIPNAAFIRLAKLAGIKFSIGTNNGGKDDLGKAEFALQMIKECGLTNKDMFMPKPDGQKKVQVKQ